jgi:hypothetical protein
MHILHIQNTVLHCCYTFRRHLCHLQAALLTKIQQITPVIRVISQHSCSSLEMTCSSNKRLYSGVCYNERCYKELFLSIQSGRYNEHSQTWIHSSKRRTNATQPMDLPQFSHPRWVWTMTPLLSPLCDCVIFMREILFIVLTKERLFKPMLFKFTFTVYKSYIN